MGQIKTGVMTNEFNVYRTKMEHYIELEIIDISIFVELSAHIWFVSWLVFGLGNIAGEVTAALHKPEVGVVSDSLQSLTYLNLMC